MIPESVKTATAIALPAAPPVVLIPSYGPESVMVFGQNVPLASMVLSILGLVMARLVAAQTDKVKGGHRWLTPLLVIILVALVIDRQPGPSMATAYGVGIGSSGIVLINLLGDKIQKLFASMFGTTEPPARRDDDNTKGTKG